MVMGIIYEMIFNTSFIKRPSFLSSMIFKRSWWFRFYQCFWEILRPLQRLRVEKLDIYFLKELLSFLIKKKSRPFLSLRTSKFTRKQQTAEHKWKSRRYPCADLEGVEGPDTPPPPYKIQFSLNYIRKITKIWLGPPPPRKVF